VLGHPDRAEAALRGVDDPDLLRLRARAQMAMQRWDDAIASLEAAARHDHDPDPWSEAFLPALRAARDAERVYATSGATQAELPLEALDLPVVRVRADTFETLALVGTGVDFVVVDPSLSGEGGVIDELALGALTVEGVPFVVRSLASVREALSAEIGLVIGAELLMRLSATIDGPRRRLVVYAEPPARAPTTDAPLLTPTAAFLAVPVRVADRETWMTLDTAGAFPIAIVSEPGEPEVQVAPSVRIGGLIVEDIPVVSGVLDAEYARAIGAPIAGSIGWTLLGQLTISFHGRRLRFE
jgi:hypothetical protein